MIFKYGLMILYIILFFSFKIDICIYISSGLNTLNLFLYRSRISKYNEQSKKSICSLNDGPNCYFTEKKYIKHYLNTKNENKNIKINDEWVYFFSKISSDKYNPILNNLLKYTTNYINLYSKEIDSKQNPPRKVLSIIMTFDDETTKKDMLLKRLTNIFYNEKLIANFEGKLRLSNDEDLPDRDKDKKDEKDSENSDYPSELYGIIESEYISISFKGKKFICNFCYIKAHDEKSKLEEINFYGFLGDKMLYGYSYTDNKERKEKWLKVFFPEVIKIDKLVISGPYDIDNISFTFNYKTNFDEEEIYYMYNYKSKEILIEDEE